MTKEQEKQMEVFLELNNQPPTSTIIVKKEKWYKRLINKIKQLKFNDIILFLSLLLNFELLILILRLFII